ncbi:MAG: DsrE/DsrF/DrsH-like family protein [Armatimonadetes bacterium]|nr:DsrE/DsrF/DrsH-like family protein [Armatimonadota bacterium]
MSEEMPKRLIIVLFSADMDKAIEAFCMAVEAPIFDVETAIFFTWWGLNLVRDPKGKSKEKQGWMKRMMMWMNRGGTKYLKMSRFQMMGMGPFMMRLIRKQGNIKNIEDLMEIAREAGVQYWASKSCLDAMGLTKEHLIPDVDRIMTNLELAIELLRQDTKVIYV